MIGKGIFLRFAEMSDREFSYWAVQAIDKLVAGIDPYPRLWRLSRKMMLEGREEPTLEEVQEFEAIAELLENEEAGDQLVRFN